MKKLLLTLLTLVAFSSSVFAQETVTIRTYRIELMDTSGTWVKTIIKTIDPNNIIQSDFEEIIPVSKVCVNNVSQDLTERAEGMFNSELGSQQLTLSITKILNLKEFQDNCSTAIPIIDTINVRIGFPLLSFEETIKTDKNTYLITAKRVRQ